MTFKSIEETHSIYRTGSSSHDLSINRFEAAYLALGSPTRKSVLDIGSFPGTAEIVFSTENRYSALGLFTPDYLAYLSQAGIPHIEANIESYNIPSDADIILFTEIIEHLRKPYAVLKNLFAMSKPGARVYITTNNASYFGYILKLLFNKDILYSISTEDTWYPGHTRYYGLDELAREVNCVGFEVLSKRYINFFPPVRYYRSRAFGSIKTFIGAIAPMRYATHIEVIAIKR